MWQFNKGEWTEAYVFLKLLGDGRIYGATADFRKNSNLYMDILEIVRYEANGKILTFTRSKLGPNTDVSAYDGAYVFAILQSLDISEKADLLCREIQAVNSTERKFSVSEIEKYLIDLHFNSPKTPKLPKDIGEEYGAKSDIILTTQDSIDKSTITQGFSIKSHMGSPSTLFNCSEGSNLIYKINGCTEEIMHRLNAIDSQLDMISAIKNDKNLSLSFLGSKVLYDRHNQCRGQIFYENLVMSDSKLPEIISCLVLAQLKYYGDIDSSNVKDLIKIVVKQNPVSSKRPETFYAKKIKDFLFDVFSGMTASTEWVGERNVSGGYIDVSRSGEMLYYRALSDDVFGSYLLEHTYIDRPDRGRGYQIAHAEAKKILAGNILTEDEISVLKETYDPKGNCGYIYNSSEYSEQCYCLKLNFQIRFR